MARQIFVNLPIKDMGQTQEFFKKLGFSFNEQFTNEQGACMVVSDTIFIMLLVEDFFQTFIKKKIADVSQTSEVIISISADSRQEVDEMIEKAVSSGGSISSETQDHGWMYNRGFQDINGHLWEVAYIDPSAINQV